ncbi:Hypothetical protein PHPALM_14091 [Phytophthora palmivora]|uniref:Uncharacterized protein n=1 Tax=Phytophthora palmivora TaxID=4796 RepID=A0A2P4XVN7_9STRA|nr:Hypothetical protein PHPALM_14091 [Phytophthora palmivora]
MGHVHVGTLRSDHKGWCSELEFKQMRLCLEACFALLNDATILSTLRRTGWTINQFVSWLWGASRSKHR